MSTAQTPAAEEHSGDRAASGPAAESVARDFFDAFNRKDVERVMSLVSDDVVEDVSGANGRPYDIRGAAFIEVHGDRVSRVTVYSDSAALARDLGILPAEGSGAERLALAMFKARVRARRALGALRPAGKGGA